MNNQSLPEYYVDAAVIAYRIPENDRSLSELNPEVTSSSGKFELSSLTDGDLTGSTFLPAAKSNQKAWIQFEFPKPETIHSLTIVTRETGSPFPGSEDQDTKGV